MSIIANNKPKIQPEHYFQHLNELEMIRKKGKHTMYNSLLKLFRKKGIKCQTLNNRTIICDGLLSGLWFTPDGTRCSISLAAWHPMYNPSFSSKKVGLTSLNLVVDYSIETLFNKLFNKKVITAGTHQFLTTSIKD
ncbi:hypothetical protein CKK33_11515 [Mucilaginibacter sp. MD40]|uniref:hypothetical protein n=1 Tax=Mucilaginibacter sp. MD40 TaxID=2029590 RepID=UPI000BACC720|nr:hypothetical protein [Mucilaginibacter sp. MD40]PAW94089.1 hypothetical protein CKK33_11515 [Mucilaginibacter sp. MD40]